MLVRLLYASRAKAGFDDEELAVIVRQARHANPENGITGVLCYCPGQRVFMQVLEGGREAVNRLYSRIAADPRHDGVQLLRYDEIDERRFAGWAMGQVDMARLNPALLLKYSERAVLDPFTVSGKVSLSLFEELVATASITRQP